MTLDDRVTALIGVGASVAANCPSCLEYHAGKARAAGADGEDVARAIEVGKTVRAGAATMMDRLAARLGQSPSLPVAGPTTGCCRC